METGNTDLTRYIHRFIPAQNGQKITLLLLHGTGGNEHDLLDLGRMLAPGAALLSPRGNVLENGMARFFRRLAEGVFDIPDLKLRVGELADFVQAAVTAYDLDPAHVVAAGFSNGANIAAALLLLRPQVLAGAALFHAMVPLVPEHLPDLAARPVFLAAGRADPIVPQENTERLAQLLQEAGAAVSMHWYNGGHTLTRPEVRDAQEWIRPLYA